jgi:flagellar FliL protein
LLPETLRVGAGGEARMAEEAAAAAAPDAVPAKGGMGKLLLIGGAVLVLAGGGGAAWTLGLIPHGAKASSALAEGDAGEATQAEGNHGAAGALVPLDPFIANLADEDGKRYLKATVQVEFATPKEPAEFKTAQVRDLLLTLFSSKQFGEIRTPEGKAVLREEIINRINRVMHKDLVKNVYFTEFIVQ